MTFAKLTHGSTPDDGPRCPDCGMPLDQPGTLVRHTCHSERGVTESVTDHIDYTRIQVRLPAAEPDDADDQC